MGKMKNVHIEISEIIVNLYKSCNEALTDQWDRSDDGFEAMIYNLEDLAKKLDVELPELEENEDL